MPDETHGLMSACRRCKGTMIPTGKERLGPRETTRVGLPYRTRFEEYRCGSWGVLAMSALSGCSVDLAHAALADEGGHLVMAESGADVQRHELWKI